MSIKEWVTMDLDGLELLEVSEYEEKRVQSFVLSKQKRPSVYKNIAIALTCILGITTATAFAFPTVASQIPFMKNVISYFSDDSNRYKNFEIYSSDIGQVQSSNGISVMIDRAVYDGTNVTVSFAVETDEDLGENIKPMQGMFNILGADGSAGSMKINKISENRYIGLATLTPFFENNINPDSVNISWQPKSFYSLSKEREFSGDWSFAFTLTRLDGNIMLLNKFVRSNDINFTVQSIEFTDLSTIINYEQLVSDEIVSKWGSVTPIFEISDNLGHIYKDRSGGGGGIAISNRSGNYLKGSTSIGAIEAGATQLIVKPIAIATLLDGEEHIEVELESIVINLER